MKSVLNQIQTTCANGNRRAACIGFILGGIIPALTFFVDRYEVHPELPLYGQIPTFLVLGGMAFSALTVLQWAKLAFHNTAKAVGFIILVEGAMIFSGLLSLAVVALVVLIAINGTATACNLVADWRREQDEMKANQRAAKKPVLRITKAIKNEENKPALQA